MDAAWVETAERISLPMYAVDDLEVPLVIAGMDARLERDTLWEEHSHPTHELLWNARGASTVTIGARTWTVTPAHGVWIPAGVPHAAAARAGTWYCTAHFGPSRVPAIAADPVGVRVTPLLRLLLERLGDRALPASSRSLAEAMVIDVLEPSPHALLVDSPASELLRPIVAALRADPADPRTLESWSTTLGVSSRTLTRAFCAETGVGFARWVARVRAHHALGLIAAGARLEDVAEATGYGSVSAFGAAFRRETGLTPGAFAAGQVA